MWPACAATLKSKSRLLGSSWVSASAGSTLAVGPDSGFNGFWLVPEASDIGVPPVDWGSTGVGTLTFGFFGAGLLTGGDCTAALG